VVGAGATSGGSLDASNILKPVLASGELKCIGSTTYHDYRSYFERDRALSRRFQRIEVPEPSVDETLRGGIFAMVATIFSISFGPIVFFRFSAG